MRDGLYLTKARVFHNRGMEPLVGPEFECELSDGSKALFVAKRLMLRSGVAFVLSTDRESNFPPVTFEVYGEPGNVHSYGEGYITRVPMVLKLLSVAWLRSEAGDLIDGDLWLETSPGE